MLERISKFGILIVGFNRPDFITERVKELQKLDLDDINIYVSLDFPRGNNSSDSISHVEILKRLKTFRDNLDFHLFIEEMNQGCDKHIPSAISRVLLDCVGVLVIEDDILIHHEQIKAIIELAKENFREMRIDPIVSMSGISSNNLMKFNKWRITPYFTAWGYFLFKDFWNTHEQLSKLEEKVIQDLLNESVYWRQMSERKKVLWSERFSRGNYDYRIQRTIFALDLKVFAPVFRMANNLGFGNTGAAHTKFSAPYYLRQTIESSSKTFNPTRITNFLVNKALIWLDSNTWAGDGWLSVRGRPVGCRTLLRKIISVIRK